MLTIALVGQKGGAGKSTISWALANAVLARNEETKVLLVETDPQGSTAAYVGKALSRHPDIASRLGVVHFTENDDLSDIIDEASSQGFDFTIIDTQGSHGPVPRNVMVLADRIIIPLRPVEHEYESQIATLRTYEALKESLESEGDKIGVCGMLLNDFRANESLNSEEKRVIGMILDNPYTLEFYMSRRKGYKALGSGWVLHLERDAANKPTDTFIRRAFEGDLSEAENVLSAIERMQ